MKYALLILAILNMFDGLVTSLGLRIGAIEELNPIMKSIWSVSPLLFVCIKVAFSVLLVMMVFRPFSLYARRSWKVAVYALVVIYTFVAGMHATWIVAVFG